MGRAFVVLLLLLAPAPAVAGDLLVTLKTPAGQPVRDAVVSFKPAAGVTSAKPAGPYRVRQINIQFDPFVLVVPVGAEVQFPNQDKVRHHVYSFSEIKRFEIKLYGRDETHSIPFTRTGVVSLGCNIHDQMMGFVVVVDTPFVAKTGAAGQVTLANIPAGGGVLTVWQPYLRGRDNKIEQQVIIPAQGPQRAELTLNLRDPPMNKAPFID